MKEDIESIYSDNAIDIDNRAFDRDFDDIEWDPIVVDDSDEEASELYGF